MENNIYDKPGIGAEEDSVSRPLNIKPHEDTDNSSISETENPKDENQSSPNSLANIKNKELDTGRNGDNQTAGSANNLFPNGLTPDSKTKIKGITRKQGALIGGGGIAALCLTLLIFALLGPLKFVQFAELLKDYHFATGDRQKQTSLRKLYVFAKTGDASKTRLGAISYAYNDKIEKRFSEKGITINKATADGKFNGATFDPKKTYTGRQGDSEAWKKHIEKEQARLKSQGMDITYKSGKIEIKAGNAKYNKSVVKFIGTESLRPDAGRISNAATSRTLLARFGLRGMYNPITKLDNWTAEKRNAAIKSLQEKMARRVNPNSSLETAPLDADSNEDPNKTSGGSELDPNDALREGNQALDDAKSGKTSLVDAFKDLFPKSSSGSAKGGGQTPSTTSKLTGKAAGLLGILCMLQGIDEGAGKARRAQLAVQGIALAGSLLAVSDKIKDGKDINLEGLAAYEPLINKFMNARSIKFEQGKSTKGAATLPVELAPSSKATELGSIFADKNYAASVGKVCKVANSKLGMVIQFGVGLAQPFTLLAQMIIANSLLPYVESALLTNNKMPDLMTEASKYTNGEPSEFINVYALDAANGNELSAGGGFMSRAVAREVNLNTKAYLLEQHQSKSLSQKLFDVYDYDSVAGRMIGDSQSSSVATMITGIPHTLTSGLQNLLTSKAAAADDLIDEDTAYYGKMVGGLPDTLLDKVDNPYENADAAKRILLSSDGGKYISMLKKCNGIDVIVSESNLDYKVIDSAGDIPDYEELQKDSDCQIKSDELTDENIVRLSVYMLTTWKGSACAEFGDEQSCMDIGVSTSTGTGSLSQQPGFKIMTFNMNSHIFDNQHPSHTWESRKPAVQSIIQTNSPDIFGAQEAFDDKMYSDIKGLFPDYGITASSSPERKNPILFKSSVFNLEKHGSELIGIGNEDSKAFTWAVLAHKSGVGKVLVVNAHLDHDNETYASRQADEIIDKINSVNKKDNNPVIVLGDFNTKIDEPSTSSSPASKFIKQGFVNTHDAATTKVHGDNKSFNGYELPLERSCKSYCQIDYILVKDPGAAIDINGFEVVIDTPGDVIASDHNPLLASMVFSGVGVNNSTGSVNTDGYAWPVDIYKNFVAGNQEPDPTKNWTCDTNPSSCHYEGSLHAVDLTDYRTQAGRGDDYAVGKNVFAIHNGTMEQVKDGRNATGCYSFHIITDDGYDYFYTHTQNPIISPGASKKVKAGEKVAVIGQRKCTGNGSWPHLHIDRAPKGQTNYGTSSRDPAFDAFIIKLHNELTR